MGVRTKSLQNQEFRKKVDSYQGQGKPLAAKKKKKTKAEPKAGHGQWLQKTGVAGLGREGTFLGGELKSSV